MTPGACWDLLLREEVHATDLVLQRCLGGNLKTFALKLMWIARTLRQGTWHWLVEYDGNIVVDLHKLGPFLHKRRKHALAAKRHKHVLVVATAECAVYVLHMPLSFVRVSVCVCAGVRP